MEIIKTSNFVSEEHSFYSNEGIYSYVNIAQLLLELNSIVKSMSAGQEIANFYTAERSLYEPLKKILEGHLPIPNLVNIENVLYKMNNKRTDVSIRHITNVSKGRLEKDLSCTHFIEIKSLFKGEKLSASDILDDLRKLIECEAEYRSVGFFVLVGLNEDLKRNNQNLTKLGSLGQNTEPFEVSLDDTLSIWLRPAGSYVSQDPFVFVWEVSVNNRFSQNRSGCTFSVFQKDIF
ncbi:hypothetical protein INP77_13605 [Methylophilus sp. 13]|uniref:hypothetical protein n=1 Tax=Methylophilus sp. 13 TaxID=2781018 RepID=UPI00188E103C|nr:hypothetical protein [Methylophilus sp. 13]MBF5040530.1 hypothetical protein [Methylophilus sp. 13]